MTAIKTLGTVMLAVSLTGCCLQKVTITPEMSAVDVQAATAGNVKVGIDILFKDCCPSAEQKALALEVQAGVVALYKKLLNGEVALDDYNQKARAAREAIETVVLVCNAGRNGEPSPAGVLPSEDDPLAAAWKRLAEVNEQLK